MPQFSLPSVLGLAAVVALVGGGIGTAVVLSANAPEECTSALQAGTTSDLVSVTPSLEGLPRASFPTPLVSDGRQLSVLAEGAGSPPGQVASLTSTSVSLSARIKNCLPPRATSRVTLFDDPCSRNSPISSEAYWSAKNPAPPW